MRDNLQFHVDGQWVQSSGSQVIDMIPPATEEIGGRVARGNIQDVDRAARRTFESFSRTSRERRLAMLDRLMASYNARGRPRDLRHTRDRRIIGGGYTPRPAPSAIGSGHNLDTSHNARADRFTTNFVTKHVTARLRRDGQHEILTDSNASRGRE